MEYQNYKIVYRRYASLFFIVGVDLTENELAILEFIHALVETFDSYFKNVVRTKGDAAVVDGEEDINLMTSSASSTLCLTLTKFTSFWMKWYRRNGMQHRYNLHVPQVLNGCIVETNKANVLAAVQLFDSV